MKKVALTMKALLPLLKLTAINLLVLVVLLEVASVGLYFLKTGEFFYARNKDRAEATEAQFQTGFQPNGNDAALSYQLHLYFGFINRETKFAAPYKKTNKDQFVIGIFGGSVANQFYHYELQNHILSGALKKLPQFQHKEIVILPFCHEAYKQPQQLLLLSYFLSIGQELDMIVNIDGFNEVALSYGNNKAGIDIAMPVEFQITPLIGLANKDLSTEHVALALEVLQVKNKLRDGLRRLIDCKFATCYAFRWAQVKYLFNQYKSKSTTFNELKTGQYGNDSLVRVNTINRPLDDPEAFEQIVNLWANSSLTMNEISEAKKIQYFEFVQPNQYFETNRQFNEQEKRIAINHSSPYNEPIVKGYPKLLLRAASLKNSGIRVFSAVNVFDETKEIAYVDNCCHYSAVGLSVFSKYVAQNIIAALNAKSEFDHK